MERDLLRTLLMLADGNHNVLETHCQMLVVGKYICQKDEYARKPVYQVTTRGELLIRALEDVTPPGTPLPVAVKVNTELEFTVPDGRAGLSWKHTLGVAPGARLTVVRRRPEGESSYALFARTGPDSAWCLLPDWVHLEGMERPGSSLLDIGDRDFDCCLQARLGA